MKKELNYSQAFEKLETLLSQLEDGDIQLEDLAVKIKQANEWIDTCETKLRKVDAEIKIAVNDANGAAATK